LDERGWIVTKPDRATRAAERIIQKYALPNDRLVVLSNALAAIIRAEYQVAEELARLTLQMGAEDLPPLLFDYKRMRELARKFLEE